MSGRPPKEPNEKRLQVDLLAANRGGPTSTKEATM